jgi:transposase
MGEAEIIQTYNDGIDAVITLIKGVTVQIGNLNDEVNILKDENQKLYIKIAELEAKINKNSSNSSKPPSSDNHKKPKNSRTKTGRPTGGQLGHEGKTLLKVENPDEVIDIKSDRCECGCDLSHIHGRTHNRQVFEMPVIKIKVTEYRTHEKECPVCKKIHVTEFPETIAQPVQYGENIQALMAYLTDYQLIPLERATGIVNIFAV